MHMHCQYLPCIRPIIFSACTYFVFLSTALVTLARYPVLDSASISDLRTIESLLLARTLFRSCKESLQLGDHHPRRRSCSTSAIQKSCPITLYRSLISITFIILHSIQYACTSYNIIISVNVYLCTLTEL